MLPSREWRGGTREEYETQHFGFGSERLAIALHGVVEHNIVTNVREMETSLMNSVPSTDEDRMELTRAHDQLISLFCRRAGPAIKRIDVEIEKLLEIPDTVVLSEDEEKSVQIGDKEYNALRSDVAALQKRVQRGALMEALLTAEEEELKSVEKHCEVAQQTMRTFQSYSTKLMGKCEAVKRVVKETDELCAGFPFIKSTFL